MNRQLVTFVAAILSLGGLMAGTGAKAVPIDTSPIDTNPNDTPIDVTGNRTSNGSTVEGRLVGNLEGNILTLNEGSPHSYLRVDLADPDPIPLQPIVPWTGRYCYGFICTITMNMNGTVTLVIDPWEFRMGGSIEFDTRDPGDPVGGTANLTAEPLSPATIGSITASARPTFSVVAADAGGPILQAAADNAAISLKNILNLANWSMSADGTGTWDSIDLGTISALMTDVGDMTDIDLSFKGVMMSGQFSYNRQITFDNGIVDVLGNALVSLFRNGIDNALDNVILDFFNDGVNDVAPELGYNCSATQNEELTRTLDAECTFDQEFHFAIDNAPAVVNAPATGGLLALAIPALLLRRRRKTGRRAAGQISTT